MPDRNSFRFAASLMFAGTVFSLLVGLLHPGREPANDHPAVFAEYAASGTWTAVHLGQFIGMAIVIAGLVIFFRPGLGAPGQIDWVRRLGLVSAIVALALDGVLQAVDGVALKQTVNAWANAPEAEKAARFANAETIRWLEWGVRSYQSVALGVAFALFGAMLAQSDSLPKPVGYLMGLAGIAYVAQGWVLGTQGFSPSNAIPTLAGIALVLASSIWLLIAAWWGRKGLVASSVS